MIKFLLKLISYYYLAINIILEDNFWDAGNLKYQSLLRLNGSFKSHNYILDNNTFFVFIFNKIAILILV